MYTAQTKIPYELFRNQHQSILVLWLNEDALNVYKRSSGATEVVSIHKPLNGIAAIFKELHLSSNSLDASIIGPYGSDTLIAMVMEVLDVQNPLFLQMCNEVAFGSCISNFPYRIQYSRYMLHAATADAPLISGTRDTLSLPFDFPLRSRLEKPQPEWPSLHNITFYSYAATIDPAVLARETLRSNIPTFGEFFRQHNLEFLETIATDRLLATALKAELKQRQVHPGTNRSQSSEDHVAIIGEWDTTYGRSIASTMVREFQPDCVDDETSNINPTCKWIHALRYERGLDGAVPSRDDKNESKTDKSSDTDTARTAAKHRAERQADEEAFDRPQGQGQQDYLRRLARSLQRLDYKLRQEKGERIAAVGVLGSDVFDKLLVLRALKPEFPEALFFTTDFDYTLTMPSERRWTRNLIIASSFGSELRSEIQGEIPPFRSSYQTSAFLAAQLASKGIKGAEVEAVRLMLSQWHNSARIFEIERNGDVLPLQTNSVSSVESESEKESCSRNLLKCKQLHHFDDHVQHRYLWNSALMLFLLLIIFGFVRAINLPVSKNQKMKICKVQIIQREIFATFVICILPIFFLVMYNYFQNAYLLWISSLLCVVWLVIVPAVLVYLERQQNPGVLELSSHCGSDRNAQSLPKASVLKSATDTESAVEIQSSPATEAEGDARIQSLPTHSVETVIIAFIIIMAIVTCVFCSRIVDSLSGHGEGEPVAFLSGVSLWPVIILRFATVLLSVCLLIRGLRKLNYNMIEIAKDMCLKSPQHILGYFYGSRMMLDSRKNSFLRRVVVWLKVSLPKMLSTQGLFSYNVETSYIVSKKWPLLVIQSRPAARVVLVVICTCLMFSVFLVFTGIFGYPNVPGRDAVAISVYRILTMFDVFCMLALLFFVADAAFSLLLFVGQLGRNRTVWPNKTKEKFSKGLNLLLRDRNDVPLNGRDDSLLLDYCLDILFIARRTGCIGELIYYPFIVIAVMILSRSTVFANFSVSLPIIITLGISSFILLTSEFALRWSAELARTEAKNKLIIGIICAKGAKPCETLDRRDHAPQLEALLSAIENMNQGAFLPLLQQPFIRAVLLPLTSIGLTILTNYGLIPGL
jgi:hypothetical protein